MTIDIVFTGETGDPQDTLSYDNVIKQALVCGHDYAVANPARAQDGFKVIICDYESDLLFEVVFRLKSGSSTAH